MNTIYTFREVLTQKPGNIRTFAAGKLHKLSITIIKLLVMYAHRILKIAHDCKQKTFGNSN